MPKAPPKPCAHPGCNQLVDGRESRCKAHAIAQQKRYDERRGSAAGRGYGYAWQQRRAAHLASEPLCRMCKAEGRLVVATVADHIIPHRGDKGLFMGELQSLCVSCHSGAKQREEAAGARTGRGGAQVSP